jgi:hypothetical protein
MASTPRRQSIRQSPFFVTTDPSIVQKYVNELLIQQQNILAGEAYKNQKFV